MRLPSYLKSLFDKARQKLLPVVPPPVSVCPPVATPTPGHPQLLLDLMPDGNLHVTAYWPKPTSQEMSDKLSGGISAVVFLLSTGQLLSVLQQSLAECGNRTGTESVSTRALSLLNQAMIRHSGKPKSADLVVPPTEVFDSKSEGFK
jgi:hypothetical protein